MRLKNGNRGLSEQLYPKRTSEVMGGYKVPIF